MQRALAIISCFIAALLLVPVQCECAEIAEQETLPEIECCVITAATTSFDAEQPTPRRTETPRRATMMPAPVNVQKILPAAPVRIMHCVFRE